MIYPVIIVKDRYHGTYSGGAWIAWNLSKAPKESQGEDVECRWFWKAYKGNPTDYPRPVGRGTNPQAAYQDLLAVIYRRENA